MQVCCTMLNDYRITIFILLACVIVRLHESGAELAANTNVNINDEKSEADSQENWKGKWMPSRPGEYTPPPKIFHKKNKTVELPQQDKDDNDDSLEHWKGKWMPSRPGEYVPPPKIYHKSNKTEQILSGFVNTTINNVCDDGLKNLEIDWDRSSMSNVCFGKKIVPDFRIAPEYYCETIPKNYRAMHQCLPETIKYVEDIPTFGTSRPVWPAYGEYEYLPAQRWLHSLERGAVVMLYHPCANTLQVELLKSLIKRCLRRHIISPNSYLDEERPLVLLAWGCKLSMSWLHENAAKQFIRENALSGPAERHYFEDGKYVEKLIEKAQLVSGDEDEHLCP